MAVLTPVAKMQFLDATGAPLVGGKVYTYAAGTTTPQPTYTDNTAATANTNPVILNARGEANIWLGSATYKFKLTDANDSEIWTVDYISAPTSSLSPVLSGNVTIDSDSAGAALTITQTGTGAVLRVRDPVNTSATLFGIDSSGQVGIGTASPSTALDLAGGTIQISSTTGTARSQISADATDSIYTAEGSRNFTIKTNSTARLTINSTAATSTVPVVLPGVPTTALQAATKSYVDTVTPPGAIIAYANSTAPTGWLLCDGSAVSRTTYATLFAAISTTWGVGDNATTFNVPDFRAQFLRGYDDRVPGSGAIDVTTVSGVLTSGSPTVSGVANTTYLYVGMPIVGTGISAGTTISGKGANSITLSANATASSGTLTCGTTNTSPDITTASTAGIFIGQAVSGTGIPTGSYIINIYNSTTFTISASATATNASVTLSFGNTLTVGRTFASAQDDDFQTHTHGINDPSHLHSTPQGFQGAGAVGGTAGATGLFSTSGSAVTGVTVNNSYSSNAETRPKNYAVLYIIKT